jgi:Glycosyl hydrolases family 2, sugar binding domain/Glycosyl hydrolases family 2, TIM barrel domain/Glycosyl hydrolases family 2
MTRWAMDVSGDNVLSEYPRPQLERPDWRSLNGQWDYAIRPKAESEPAAYDGKILVPFAVESALSGVTKQVGSTNRLWYRRTFEWPELWHGKRAILHFGAVDWQTAVVVNGQEVGTHQGGYTPFSIDITDALKSSGVQNLVVAVWDPTDGGSQPRGKQSAKPDGIWYTSVTGIWQTVWLEPVMPTSIVSLKIVPDIDAGTVQITPEIRGSTENVVIDAAAYDGKSEVARAKTCAGAAPVLSIPNAKLWTPDSPNLYRLKVSLLQNDKVVDTASSYFGMRKISLMNDQTGHPRLSLNNRPLFQFGPLDQGWWPDGLYTAPTDAALKYDIEMIKKLGFNMARKHVKVEPERWYYWCDVLGLLVWQDMPSGFATNTQKPEAPFSRTPDEAKEFETELKEVIDTLRDHPSIVMWVPFNEGWGQFDTERIVQWIKQYDPTRLVDDASGWTDKNVGDVHDMHHYPGPSSPKPESQRAVVLGEFGGLGLQIDGHTWQEKRNWGYRSFTSGAALTAEYLNFVQKLHALVGSQGLSAGVYTQITDVEGEINGLMTYDREIVKVDVEQVAAANRRVYTDPPPEIQVIVPNSQEEAIEWRYSTDAPSGDWFAVDFNDDRWRKGLAGFGTPQTPNTKVRTTWDSSDIWIRRTLELPNDLKLHSPAILLHHDEDAEVYLNGTLAAKLTGFNNDDEAVPLDRTAVKLLRPGKNTIAVHCHQTTGGQYIDVGIVDVVPANK